MSFSEPEMQAVPTVSPKLQGILKTTATASAINCTKSTSRAQLSHAVRKLVSNSLSENSLRAYASDLRELENWGGPLPWPPEDAAEYLAQHADRLSVATLLRRLASMAKAHRSLGRPDPTKSELVKATMRGVRRNFGSPQRQAKPILREDLLAICLALGNTTKDVRDRAMLLLGFAGAFRRSELVGLEVSDIEEARQGIVVTLRTSKTDQYAHGRKIAIPFGRTELCPVKSVLGWLERASISSGPVFRPVNQHGQISSNRLSPEAVCSVLRERCKALGYDPSDFSGHSLRAGLATSAAIAGVSNFKIRQQTGHASDAMLARYIRDADLWVGNAAAALL